MVRWRGFLQLAALAPLAFGTGSGASAPAGPKDMLVSVDWLAEHVGDPKVAVLFVGRDTDFAAAHIPGARYLDLRSIVVDREGIHYELPSADSLRSVFQNLGVSDDSRIVLYFSSWASPTTRAYFTLAYLGLGDNTAVLNGGLPAWKAAGNPVTADEVAPARPGSLRARPTADIVRDRAWVKAHLHASGVRIVDARDAEYYASTEPTEMMREGHLPGAVNLPYQSVFDESDQGLFFKPTDQLRELFTQAGVKPGEEVVAYCHIGQQATAVWFSARLLGYDVKLYDGSFHDWSDTGEPVETS